MRSRWHSPFHLSPSHRKVIFMAFPIKQVRSIFTDISRSTVQVRALRRKNLWQPPHHVIQGSSLFLVWSICTNHHSILTITLTQAVVQVAEQGLLFRSLESGDGQPGREVGSAAGLAQFLQSTGGFCISLFPVFIFSKILNCQLSWRKPFLHFPKTCGIWLLDSWPSLIIQFNP